MGYVEVHQSPLYYEVFLLYDRLEIMAIQLNVTSFLKIRPVFILISVYYKIFNV
jgi:hypothetical protein